MSALYRYFIPILYQSYLWIQYVPLVEVMFSELNYTFDVIYFYVLTTIHIRSIYYNIFT